MRFITHRNKAHRLQQPRVQGGRQKKSDRKIAQIGGVLKSTSGITGFQNLTVFRKMTVTPHDPANRINGPDKHEINQQITAPYPKTLCLHLNESGIDCSEPPVRCGKSKGPRHPEAVSGKRVAYIVFTGSCFTGGGQYIGLLAAPV